MYNSTRAILNLESQLLSDGISISVEGKKFQIKYPFKIWQKTPSRLKQVLLENIAFAETHWLPLILNKEKVAYNTPPPLFEPLLFKNQLYDLLFCEEADKVKQLTYLKKFYNLEFEFKTTASTWPDPALIPKFNNLEPTAVIPFTFGKESLTTLALCLELGIKPVLVYCQEPVQPFEEEYKKKKLAELKAEYKIDGYFIEHQPGLFRYGQAFKTKKASEIGWGTQITLLALLMLPFIYAFKARYIFFGNENSNNEIKMVNDWKVYPSADQTREMTGAQSNLIRLLTNNQCQVKSSLEPLEEINIFYLLHHRYPELSKYQFSCSAEEPLYDKTQWCHHCYKCCRMYLFAQSLGMSPRSIGFRANLLNKPSLWKHYFGEEVKTGSNDELDFAFYLLHRRGDKSTCVKKFKREKLAQLKPWAWYIKYFTELKSTYNLPKAYQQKLLSILNQELADFKKLL